MLSAKVRESESEPNSFFSFRCFVVHLCCSSFPCLTQSSYSTPKVWDEDRTEWSACMLGEEKKKKGKEHQSGFYIPERCTTWKTDRKLKKKKSGGADGAVPTAGGLYGSYLSSTNDTHNLRITFSATIVLTLKNVIRWHFSLPIMVLSQNCGSKYK